MVFKFTIPKKKPVIVFLTDYRNWAFDYVARSIVKRLKEKYQFYILYSSENPNISKIDFDLIYVFFWGEHRLKQWNIPREKVIKEVASLRWKLEPKWGLLSAEEFVDTYLADALVVTTPARLIWEEIQSYHSSVFLCPNGFEPSIFYPPKKRSGNLVIGWVGNPNDKTKGLYDILLPATQKKFDFRFTSGKMSRQQIAKFYRDIDVIAISSLGESQPLPLIEGMASGCFPVTTSVGITSQMICHQVNGLILERNIEAFREGFKWCNYNLNYVRSTSKINAYILNQSRIWDNCATRFVEIFEYALDKQSNSICLNQKINVLPNLEIESPTATIGCKKIQDSIVETIQNDQKRFVKKLSKKWSHSRTYYSWIIWDTKLALKGIYKRLLTELKGYLMKIKWKTIKLLSEVSSNINK